MEREFLAYLEFQTFVNQREWMSFLLEFGCSVRKTHPEPVIEKESVRYDYRETVREFASSSSTIYDPEDGAHTRQESSMPLLSSWKHRAN